MNFLVDGETVDSVELKCLVISRGLKIDREVYQKCGKDFRIYPNALKCNSFPRTARSSWRRTLGST